jgi:NAD(P)-dependent dehydrogenase (short-subunit alcohol dehydrogenase family)
MSLDLTSKTAVITGAGSGIGRETALACARRGAALALCDIDEAGLAQTADAARALGAEVLTARVDVADPDDMDAFAAQVDHVDLLVNNAGIGVFGLFVDTELEDWRRLLDINVMGVVHGCWSFVPRMIERGRGGHVVNLSSQAGIQASPALPAYSASKFAVFGFSEALRTELKPHGIGVTAVCPGIINTPITRNSTARGTNIDARREKVVKLYERRNYGPEKVAVRILRAVERDRAVAPIAPEAHIAYVMSRLAPPLSRWVAAKMAAMAD